MVSLKHIKIKKVSYDFISNLTAFEEFMSPSRSLGQWYNATNYLCFTTQVLKSYPVNNALLFTPFHAIQCLNSREIAGTSVNIVAGVWGRAGAEHV